MEEVSFTNESLLRLEEGSATSRTELWFPEKPIQTSVRNIFTQLHSVKNLSPLLSQSGHVNLCCSVQKSTLHWSVASTGVKYGCLSADWYKTFFSYITNIKSIVVVTSLPLDLIKVLTVTFK